MFAVIVLLSPLAILVVAVIAALIGSRTAPPQAFLVPTQLRHLLLFLWGVSLLGIIVVGLNSPTTFAGHMEVYWVIGGLASALCFVVLVITTAKYRHQ